MKTIFTLSIISLLIAFSSCEKDNSTLPETGIVLFQYYYQNYAWEYIHTGIIIDSEGIVYTFTNPETWNFNSCDTTIKASLLNANLNYTDNIIDTIEYEVLQEKVALIFEAAKGDIAPTGLTMCDAGISCYYAYILNSTTNLYTPVLLYQGGDIEFENSNSSANELYQWLASLRIRDAR